MRYFDFCESDAVRAFLSFEGPPWNDEPANPSLIDVTVVARAYPQSPYPWTLAWRQHLQSNAPLVAPWHGYNLVELVGETVVVVVGTDLVAFAASSGEEVWRTVLGPTPIWEMLVFDASIVVLSVYPLEGNAAHLVGLTLEGARLWQAEPPQGDAFVGRLVRDGTRFSVGTYRGRGMRCTIDSETGDVIRRGYGQ
ncbi:MAG: PQQ-binding-like beta-propeller repeat protein [Bacteroidota bacterium]